MEETKFLNHPANRLSALASICALCFTLLTSCIKLDANLNSNNALALLGGVLTSTGYNKFQAYSNNNPFFLESSGDGTWTRVNFTGASAITDVVQIGQTLYGVNGLAAAPAIPAPNTIFKSLDHGRTWSAVTVSTGGNIEKIASCGTSVAAARNGGGNINAYYSADTGLNFGSLVTLYTTGAPLRDFICSNNRYLMNFSASEGVLFADSPITAWNLSTGSFAAASNLLASNNKIIQYYSSATYTEQISTNNGQTLSSTSNSVTGTGLLALGSIGTKIFRSYISGANCVLESANDSATLSWSSVGSVNCGLGPQFFSSATNSNTMVVGGSANNGAGTPFPMIFRGRTNVSVDSQPAGLPTGSIIKVIFVQ